MEEKKSTYNGFTEARKKANARYMEENGYVDLKIRVEKDFAEEIKDFARSKGESVSSFINRAIDELMGKKN